MKSISTYKTQPLIFRQWSRKSYAIFASLGKEITIGHVDADITDKSIEKSNEKNPVIIAKSESIKDEEETDEPLFDPIGQQFISTLLVSLNSDESSWQPCHLITYSNLKYLNNLPCNSGHVNLLNKFRDYDN